MVVSVVVVVVVAFHGKGLLLGEVFIGVVWSGYSFNEVLSCLLLDLERNCSS